MMIDEHITGVVMREVNTHTAKHWVDGEEVVEVSLKSDKDSGATYTFVLDQKTAEKLSQYLSIAFL